jgi:small-conductance mechanosensitive channel
MDNYLNLLKDWITPVAYVVGGFLIGLFLRKFIISRIHRFAKRTNWEGDEVIIGTLRGTIVILMVLLGLYLALPHLPLSTSALSITGKVLFVLAILLVTLLLARVSNGFIDIYFMKARGEVPSTSILKNSLIIIFFIIATLIILNHFGISITPILTALGVGGLAVALALQGPLNNFFSGLQIIFSGEIMQGHYIKLDSGEEGYVVDITWRTTSVRERPDNIIVIPNSKLADAILKNYNAPEAEMILYIEVGVSYDSDLEEVERITNEVAHDVLTEFEGGVENFKPFIRYESFGESSINFRVRLRITEFGEKFRVGHEFIKRLHKRYNEEGINIPFPIRTVYMHNGKDNKGN